MLMEQIAVVIVLYYPEQKHIDHVLNLSSALDVSLIVVDNTPNRSLQQFEKDNSIVYIPLFENKGIAEAQNVGIRKAKAIGCSFVSFLDQDSVLPANYMETLVAAYKRIDRNTSLVAVVGPTVVDKETGEEYHSLIHRDSKDSDYIVTRQLISSGSIIPMRMFEKVGLMDSSLFIDYVDHEWCWRANSLGLQCVKLNTLVLLHHIGYRTIHIGAYQLEASSPIRYYYQYRNYFLLVKRMYVPRYWKIVHGTKLLFRPLWLPFCLKETLATWKYMFLGIRDGFKYLIS